MDQETQVAFVIRDEEERRHKNGISSLQLDPIQGKLYTAGRDGIIRVWDTTTELEDRYIRSMEHHTDWVNDIVLCCGGMNLISASSDTTIKVWDATKGFWMSSLSTHQSCVQRLAYAKDKEHLASSGMDYPIYLWDINTLQILNACHNNITTRTINGNKEIYSIVMNPPGTILVSGSADKVLRAWDPRSCEKLLKIKGHADTVKALVLSTDGQQLISGSSDGVIKWWALGERKCVASFKVHLDEVVALLATENFSHVISGGRDKVVIITELQNPDNSIIICEETAPILKLCFTADQQSVWVSTSGRDVRCWKLPPLNIIDTLKFSKNVYQTQPTTNIPGSPAIQHYKILNDKRHILTIDTANNVALYDVLKACKVEELDGVDFEEELKKQSTVVYVPDWFNVDIKTGMLKIYLRHHETDCLSAWASAKDVGLTSDIDDAVNYGVLLLQALLEYWNHPNRLIESGRKVFGNPFFSVPSHTPLLISEIDGLSFFRLQVGDAGGEMESKHLMEIVPSWVVDVAVEMAEPALNKLPFYLVRYGSTIKHKKDRVVANDFIQCRKVAEHVVEKILDGGNGSRVELLCDDQVLDLNVDLRTVRHFISKSNDDLTLHYRVLEQ